MRKRDEVKVEVKRQPIKIIERDAAGLKKRFVRGR